MLAFDGLQFCRNEPCFNVFTPLKHRKDFLNRIRALCSIYLLFSVNLLPIKYPVIEKIKWHNGGYWGLFKPPSCCLRSLAAHCFFTFHLLLSVYLVFQPLDWSWQERMCLAWVKIPWVSLLKENKGEEGWVLWMGLNENWTSSVYWLLRAPCWE